MEDQPPHLDLVSEPPPMGESDAGSASFLGVTFECCSVYARLYRNRAGTAYEGRCPRCLNPLRIGIGPGGANHRFFTAS